MADGWDQSRPASIIVPLSVFDARVLTFTYPDNMTSSSHAWRPGDATRAFHGQVHTLREIEDVVRRHGFPDPKLPRDLRGADAFIEVQVWDDRPLAEYRD